MGRYDEAGWCLIAEGRSIIEQQSETGLRPQEFAKSLGQDQCVTRANGELGLIAFLEGNPGHAARLLGGRKPGGESGIRIRHKT